MMTADGSGSPRSEQSENENWEVVGHSSQSGDAHLIAPAGELQTVCMLLVPVARAWGAVRVKGPPA